MTGCNSKPPLDSHVRCAAVAVSGYFLSSGSLDE